MGADPALCELPVAELVEALAAAPPGAGSRLVQEIIRRFEPLLRRTWRQGGFDVEYADFVQEVFTELFAGLPALRQPRAFPGYLQRVALSVAARQARKARREEAVAAEAGPALERVGADLFARAAVRSVLEHLPAREREVIEGLFLEGSSVPEVASELGLAQGSVRTSKSRAIRRLRKVLEAEAEALEKTSRADDAKPG